MQSISSQPYAKRPVPTTADELPAWLGVEFASVQRGMIRASSITVTTAYTARITDGLILVDATAGPVTLTLPAPATVHDMVIVVKKIDVSGNAVTLGGTVDGAVNPTLATQYKSMTVWADISANPLGAWYKIASI